MRWWLPLVLSVLGSACTIPRAIHNLDAEAPPAEFGRPAWIRGTARAGALIGAVGGAVVSVVALPVTYPMSLLADEPLGMSAQELMLMPVVGGASMGHFVFGAPVDMVDFVFRRAWVDAPEEQGFSFTAMPPPVGPGREPAEDPAGATQQR